MATRKYTKRSGGNNSWGQETVPIVRERTVRPWSDYQQAIFKDVAEGTGHTVVNALAGSSKTTVTIESLYHLPLGVSCLLVAFNKSIQTELAARAPEGVEVCTLHSLGLRAVTRAFGKVQIDANKSYPLIESVIGKDPEVRDMVQAIFKAVSLCKGYLATTPSEIDEVLDKHSIDAGLGDERGKFITNVQQVLKLAKEQTNIIDFDDMVNFPVSLKLSTAKYMRVFCDEAQDLNKAQLELALMHLKEGGRFMATGDKFQALYGFAGADSASIDNIISRLQAKTLPLTITYRCPKAVVRLAQTIVPSLEHAPNAEEGIVRDVSEEEMKKNVKGGDYILSRVNAPLISLCMYFLKNGRPASIAGRDVGTGLVSLIKKSKAKSISEFLDYIESWRNRECGRLAAKRKDTTSVEDRADCLIALCEGAVSLNDVKQNIEKLFSDVGPSERIMLSSIHRAKGGERDNVWVLAKTLRTKQGGEEANIAYVAYSRAKKSLYLVR
jgi:DNA helicase-2/ATP-dependent DNA helicase PcrA